MGKIGFIHSENLTFKRLTFLCKAALAACIWEAFPLFWSSGLFSICWSNINLCDTLQKNEDYVKILKRNILLLGQYKSFLNCNSLPVQPTFKASYYMSINKTVKNWGSSGSLQSQWNYFYFHIYTVSTHLCFFNLSSLESILKCWKIFSANANCNPYPFVHTLKYTSPHRHWYDLLYKTFCLTLQYPWILCYTFRIVLNFHMFEAAIKIFFSSFSKRKMIVPYMSERLCVHMHTHNMVKLIEDVESCK